MMACDEDVTQAIFDTTVGMIELLLELSVCVLLAASAISQATTPGQIFTLPLGPIKGELLLDKTLSAELEARLLIDSSLDEDFKSLSRSSSLEEASKSLIASKALRTRDFMGVAHSRETHFILSMMYLSGMRPSLPAKAPLHQSLLTCVYNVKVSPFLKLSSLSDRALKSNCAVASRFSDSAPFVLNLFKQPINKVLVSLSCLISYDILHYRLPMDKPPSPCPPAPDPSASLPRPCNKTSRAV
jgi:hypothetical protein